jgi:hypothetical protein
MRARHFFTTSMLNRDRSIPYRRLTLAASFVVNGSWLNGCSGNSPQDASNGVGGNSGATGGAGVAGASKTSADGTAGGTTGGATASAGGSSATGGSASAVTSVGGSTSANVGGASTGGTATVNGGGTTSTGGTKTSTGGTATAGMGGNQTGIGGAAAGAGGAGIGGSTSGAGGNTRAGAGGTGTGGAATNTGGTKAATGGATTGTGGTKTSGGTTGTGGASLVATGGASTGGGTASAPGSLYNGIQWADTSGNPIQAHGGGVIKVGSYYYWFGENRNSNGTFYAVSCYRSADLVHWEFRNNVLSQNSATELKPANIERPKVIYNASTNKYVMWMHWENGSDYSASRAAVASCDTVDGNYTYVGSARPLVSSGVVDHGTVGYQSRDCTAFVDTDGRGYFISASNENYDLNLYLLKSDYLSIDSLAATLFKGGHREAPALWKRNNVYFLLTSAATGWDPNQAQYATSSSLTSGWSGWANVGDSTTFYSQSTFVVPVQGSAGTAYLYMGDRWAGAWSEPVNNSTYIWLPISFSSNTALSMSWSNTITIDASAGSITGATNRFTYINKGSNKAMSVENASTADHANVVQVTYSGANEQRWALNYDAAGYFNVTNVNSSKVLDVTSGSTADGAALIQYTSNNGDNQKWRVVDKGAGYYQLLNKQSSRVAEVPAGSTAEGAALDQRAAAANSDNQLWQMGVAR